MSDNDTKVTQEVVEFISGLEYADLPAEALRIAKRCILDGLGVILAGSFQKCTAIVREYGRAISAPGNATVLGGAPLKLPAAAATLVNATAGHAMDWDDTQLSATPDRVYGLLTHPTMPPLTASLAIAETLGKISGKQFLTAFLAGFEIECKIAEAINPHHYLQGFHSSGTMGTFGSAVAAAKLLDLNPSQLKHALGMAASMAAGIRTNFGTMTKPLHVGRAAQNGVTAALLAKEGFEANEEALDGPWGFFLVFGGGFAQEKIAGRLGNPHNIISPGVSIKPYPCGVLTHPSMDAMLKVVTENDLAPDDIERAALYAGSNICAPIRYAKAHDELEAKFCMPFLLAAIVRSRKAGVREFTAEFVNDPVTQDLMDRISMEFDPAIEARGWDKIVSRLEVVLKNGEKIVAEAAPHYRGGPENPLSAAELQAKFTDCTGQLLTDSNRTEVFAAVSSLESLSDMADLIALLQP